MPTADSPDGREWLCTNGIGGYAAGTVSGVLTRRYHGLLVAALHPPLGRTVMAAKVDEVVEYAGGRYALGADRWADDTLAPQGYHHLRHFRLDGTSPVWTYAAGEARLEKRVWMEPGANQILAVSLAESPLSPARQRGVVEACARELLTPYGLRS